MAKGPLQYKKILVIKLGALGDFVQALAACRSIHEYHQGAKITLLTTSPYVEIAKSCPYFDFVWDGGRPDSFMVTWSLVQKIRKEKFDRIYDLQTSSRTNRYYTLLWPFRPEWSGIAKGASHYHKNRKRAKMHTLDRQAEQLAMAGVGLGQGRVGGTASAPDLSWATEVQKGAARTELTWFGVRKPFALIVPGSTPNRPAKRWPAQNYGQLAMRLRRAGFMPVIIGTETEQEDTYIIQQACPGALSLINRTDFIQIIMLARQAHLAIGNDTGPMHLIASSNCPSMVLFSSESNPDLCAPRGADVTVLKRKKLAELGVGEVWETLQTMGKIDPHRPPHADQPIGAQSSSDG